MPQTSNASYRDQVKKIRTSRRTNIGLCLAGVIVVLAGIVFAFGTPYRYAALLFGAVLLFVLFAILAKSAREANVAFSIAENGVYAVKLTAAQQRRIKKHQMRRGFLFSFSAFLLCVMPEAIVLTAMYLYFDSQIYLLCAAVFSLLCLIGMLLSLLYLSVRLSAKEAYVTVSETGILVARDILRFRAKKHEALSLLKFSDYYYLKFVKSAICGIKYESSVIFPIDGVLRKGTQKTVDEALVGTLGVDGVFITEDAFYESRNYLADVDEDSAANDAKERQRKPKKQEKPVREKKSSRNKNEAAVKEIKDDDSEQTVVLTPQEKGFLEE